MDVYFQPNAWADTNFCVDWFKKTLKPTVEDEDHFILFLNNLEGKKADSFKCAIAEIDGLPHYGLVNATDIWQPVDAGYAQLLKIRIKQEFFSWLDDSENADL